jgi:hypothetical protein
MEYLMTYGWAILVVMIVGIVMWQLGIFNMGGTAPTSSGFPKIKPQLTSCKMTTAGAFSCLFTNGAGTAITINGTTVAYGSTVCTATAPVQGDTVGLNDNFQVSANGCPTGVQGDQYSVEVSVWYTQSVAGTFVARNESGIVKGGYEQT